MPFKFSVLSTMPAKSIVSEIVEQLFNENSRNNVTEKWDKIFNIKYYIKVIMIDYQVLTLQENSLLYLGFG